MHRAIRDGEGASTLRHALEAREGRFSGVAAEAREQRRGFSRGRASMTARPRGVGDVPALSTSDSTGERTLPHACDSRASSTRRGARLAPSQRAELAKRRRRGCLDSPPGQADEPTVRGTRAGAAGRMAKGAPRARRAGFASLDRGSRSEPEVQRFRRESGEQDSAEGGIGSSPWIRI